MKSLENNFISLILTKEITNPRSQITKINSYNYTVCIPIDSIVGNTPYIHLKCYTVELHGTIIKIYDSEKSSKFDLNSKSEYDNFLQFLKSLKLRC